MSFSLKELQKTHDVAIRWRAFELRPAGSPPIPPEYLARIEAARPRFAQMMRDDHAIEVKPGPFGLSTRRALIAAKVAEACGPEIGQAMHEALLGAYWIESRDIEDETVLAELAEGAGIDRDAFLADLSDPKFEIAVDADIQQAHHYGLNGVPALVFENRYLISGTQPAAVLREAVDRLQAELDKRAAEG